MIFIREWRRKRGLTQEQLAEALGIHVNTLNRWERGFREPRATKIHELCNILQVAEADLLNGVKDSEHWVLKIRVSKNPIEEEEIDMTDMACIADLNFTPDGAALTLQAGYGVFQDDEKFDDLIQQLQEVRQSAIDAGKNFAKWARRRVKGMSSTACLEEGNAE